MEKIVSLIKACMTDNMNIFKIKTKNKSEKNKKIIPLILAGAIFMSIYSYSDLIMEPLIKVNAQYFLLVLFVVFTSMMTLMEGIYKSGSILFNCKDDNLLLSLPIKRTTVLFVRIFKFYIFELVFNSLFFLPGVLEYAQYGNIQKTYFLVSFIALLLLPIIPIIISCVIGAITTAISSKFKFKNIVQIIITMIFMLAMLYSSFNIENIIKNISQNAASISEVITKIYYPAGAYIKLVTDFNVLDLIVFIAIHLILAYVSIYILSKVYFKINSNSKEVKTNKRNKKYKIKTAKPMKSLIKKELKKFINSPVLVINAAFGLVLFVVGCILVCVKFNSIAEMLIGQGLETTKEQLTSYIPAILFGFICFSSLMSSITSSMISLEGKSFNILKSLPVSPFKIILSKVLAAVLIVIPFILVGDLIIFATFKFNITEIILLIVSSILLPLVAETFGIVVNIKYPKMNAENDTEVVKQSMSSTVCVFAGFLLSGATVVTISKGISKEIPVDLIIGYGAAFYFIIYTILLIYLNKKSVKDFNKINI